MVNFLGGVFASIFGANSWLATILISMFPMIELKGGIPVGMSVDFWGENALNGTAAFLFALLGSSLVVPIIAVIFKPILNWLKKTKVFRKLGELIDEKVKKHSESINNKADEQDNANKSSFKKILAKWFAIFAFVAVPLPLTGVWTGTCVAVAIGLNFWQTITAAVLGNIVAGLIIVFVCSAFPQFTTILFLIFLAIIALMIIYAVIKLLIKKHNRQE